MWLCRSTAQRTDRLLGDNHRNGTLHDLSIRHAVDILSKVGLEPLAFLFIVTAHGSFEVRTTLVWHHTPTHRRNDSMRSERPMIKFADQRIEEARKRVVALDRDLVELGRQSYSPHLSREQKQELRAQTASLGRERCDAYAEFVELTVLVEMSPEHMGWA